MGGGGFSWQLHQQPACRTQLSDNKGLAGPFVVAAATVVACAATDYVEIPWRRSRR